MWPLVLGLIAGGTSALGNMLGGLGEADSIKKRNKRLDEQKSKVESEYSTEKDRLTKQQVGLATDFLTNYITIREKDRADSLRSEYGRNQSEFSIALSRMLSEKNQLLSRLESQKQDSPSTGNIIGQSLIAGAGAGMQGYASGLQLEAANKFNKTLANMSPIRNINALSEEELKQLRYNKQYGDQFNIT